MSEYNRTYLAGETPRTNYSDSLFLSQSFQYVSMWIAEFNFPAVPTATTGCHQFVEIGLCNEEVP
jgi:hypothetical protein